MTMKTVKTASILLAAVLGLAARPATADTVVTGSIGRAFSGDLLTDHVNYGASIGFLGNVFGFEVEGTYSPDVFGDTPAGTNNITTLMGNVVLGAPLGRTSRLYASAGVGLMKFRVPDFDTFFDVSRNDFGMDAGAGVMVGFGGALGVRGDIRYFRDLKSGNRIEDVDFGSFHYWRGSAGVTLRF